MKNSGLETLQQAASLVDGGEFAAADLLCRKLLLGDPANAHALHILGVSARKSQRCIEAAELLAKAIELDPTNSAVHFERGAALIEIRRLEEALAHFQRSAELNPQFQAACINASTCLERLDRMEEALPWCERAIQIKPDCAIAHFNRGNILRSLGRVNEAIAEFDAAAAFKSEFATAHWNASLCRLLAGDFEQGWPLYEWREKSGEVTIDRYPQPRWQGESLTGKTILIHAEQGIGDEILFGSCFPDLIAQAGKVVLVCEPRLAALYSRSFPTAKVYGVARRKDWAPAEVSERIDYQLPAGSLPGFFRKSLAAFPQRWRFLSPRPQSQIEWRSRFDDLGSGLKIGISWRAGGQPIERRKRTTTLEEWLPILRTPGVHFINLQYGEAAGEIADARHRLGITIHDFAEADPLVDMDAFAAKVAALDLVISVGNATVHLAGALGIPAWTLLPISPAWRWMTSGEQSVWYPSVRLFRQQKRNEWGAVIDDVAKALTTRTGRVVREMPVATRVTSRKSAMEQHFSTLAEVTATMQTAILAFEAGELAKAESICVQILDHAPRDVRALHMRGLIARRTGRTELAIKSLSLAVRVFGGDAQMQAHLAGAYAEAGRTDEAIASYREALVLDPQSWIVHFDLGTLLRSAGRREEAIASFERAISLEPENAKAYNALAGAQMELLHWADAERSLRKAIELKPDYMAAFNNLGQVMRFQNRLVEARDCFERALEIEPGCRQAKENLATIVKQCAVKQQAKPQSRGFAEKVARAAQLYNDNSGEALRLAEEIIAEDCNNLVALRILGVTARQTKDLEGSLNHLKKAVGIAPNDYALQFECGVTLLELYRTREALVQFKRAVELRPTFHPSYVNISAIYEQQERYEEVAEWARKALAIKPDCGLTCYNLANALRELGELEAAIEMYQRSMALNPQYVKAGWNLGLSQLLVGDYANGWPAFEKRIEMGEVAVDRYSQPRWDGSPIPSKTLLIHAEQGIGDEVLFASCFDDVISRVGKCVIVCEPRLEKIFRRTFSKATVYGFARRKDGAGMVLGERIDFQIPAGSLPMLLRRQEAEFPQRNSFLIPDEQRAAIWRERLAALGPGLKVGISWRAGGKPQERRKRMIPLEDWRDVLTTSGVQFINLQYSDSTDEVDRVCREFGINIHDWEEGDPLVDMDDFAAKIQSLDLVISVGNATVHVAGAVGTPAWTLLPMVPSWRWMVRGEQSPWYPSVRLFRQPQRGDWQSVLDCVAERLRKQVGAAPVRSKGLATKPQANEAFEEWYEAKEIATDVMIESIGTSMEEADRCLAEGRFERAEELYREVLQIAPRQYQALHGLGMVSRQTGRLELAIRSFQRSLAMIEPIAAHHFNFAGTLAEAGRYDDAAKEYTRTLELEPGMTLARVELGRVLQRLGEHDNALGQFNQALANDANSLLHPEGTLPAVAPLADLHVLRGKSLAAVCRIDEAIECFEQALRIIPVHVPALVALADVYAEEQQHDEAERCLRRAMVQEPDRVELAMQLGRLLRRAEKIEEAIDCLEALVARVPGDIALLADLGALHREMAEPAIAAEYYRQALRLAPFNAELLNSLGLALAEQGDFAIALEHYVQAIAMKPDYALCQLNRAFALLQQGEFEAGWQAYESRWKSPTAPRARNFPIAAWDGASLKGKTILIHGEQGVGDEIMFASCYRDVITQARKVVIVCQPRLEQLFRRSFSEAMVIAVTRGQESMWRPPANLSIDMQIAAGSLPRFLRRDANDFPARADYLVPDQAKVAHWLERFAALGPGLKVGISWRAGETSLDRRLRGESLTPWQPVLGLPGANFVSLQYGDCADELAAFNQQTGMTVHHWADADNHNDLDGLAARIAALDLVISVGNATAHLAGSIGAPTWVVLPAVPSWRWRARGAASLWYPSVRLCSQTQMGDWAGVFERAAGDLLNEIGRRTEKAKRDIIVAPHLTGSTSPWILSPGMIPK